MEGDNSKKIPTPNKNKSVDDEVDEVINFQIKNKEEKKKKEMEKKEEDSDTEEDEDQVIDL